MADRDYRYRIGAQDDATKVFEKIAGSAKREMGKVDDAFDDAENGGKSMARAMKTIADDLERELDGTARAADKLGEALGPDLRGKIGDAGLDKFVTDLRTAGLSFDDIEGEADELAAALARIDDVSVKSTSRLNQGLRDVDTTAAKTGDTVDRTGSVFANFAGNAVQDIPGISGSFGALNVAAGQFAEYAAEGGIQIGNMAKALGPIALATVAIGVVNSQLDHIAKTRAFDKDQIEEWTQAIRDGSTAFEAMADQVRDSGKFELAIGDNIVDVLPRFEALGLSMSDFQGLTRLSADQLAAWKQQLLDSGVNLVEANGLIGAVTAAQGNLASSSAAAAATERFLGHSVEDLNAGLEEQTERNQETADAVRGLTDALLAQFDAQIAARDAANQTIEAVAAYRTAVDDTTTPVNELQVAQDSAAEAALRQAQAMVEAAGATNGSVEGNRILVDSLQSVADQLGPNDPLRAQLQGYIDEIHNTPTTAETRFVAYTADAVREVQRLQREIAGVSANSHEVNFNVRTPSARAKGGPVEAGKAYIVGEEGPELAIFGSSGTVVPNDRLGSVAAPSVDLGPLLRASEEQTELLAMLVANTRPSTAAPPRPMPRGMAARNAQAQQRAALTR